MACDGHHEKAIYFLRPNGFTIMKIRRLSRYRRDTVLNKGRKRSANPPAVRLRLTSGRDHLSAFRSKAGHGDCIADVRYWHKADMAPRLANSVFGGKADIRFATGLAHWVCSGGEGSGRQSRPSNYLSSRWRGSPPAALAFERRPFNSTCATTAPEKLPSRVCDLANSQYRLLTVVRAC